MKTKGMVNAAHKYSTESSNFGSIGSSSYKTVYGTGAKTDFNGDFGVSILNNEFDKIWFANEFSAVWLVDEFSAVWLVDEFSSVWLVDEFSAVWMVDEFGAVWMVDEFHAVWMVDEFHAVWMVDEFHAVWMVDEFGINFPLFTVVIVTIIMHDHHQRYPRLTLWSNEEGDTQFTDEFGDTWTDVSLGQDWWSSEFGVAWYNGVHGKSWWSIEFGSTWWSENFGDYEDYNLPPQSNDGEGFSVLRGDFGMFFLESESTFPVVYAPSPLDYVNALYSTGCPGGLDIPNDWKANGNAFNEMFAVCEANRLGVATEDQQTQCCGSNITCSPTCTLIDSFEVNRYAETFQKTGCPRPFDNSDYWSQQSDSGLVDMMTVCLRNKMKTATVVESDMCCGTGESCTPVCTLQIELAGPSVRPVIKRVDSKKGFETDATDGTLFHGMFELDFNIGELYSDTWEFQNSSEDSLNSREYQQHKFRTAIATGYGWATLPATQKLTCEYVETYSNGLLERNKENACRARAFYTRNDGFNLINNGNTSTCHILSCQNGLPSNEKVSETENIVSAQYLTKSK
eukprot:Awhi_evm2s1410